MDFEEYITQGEPGRKERAENWQVAIGLQAVDGLKPSRYLLQTAQDHIEERIGIDEVDRRIAAYYQTEQGRHEEAGTDEADGVSARIARLLAEDAFTFSPAMLAAIHRRLFEGILLRAGRYRQNNIKKKEWVLDGASVLYSSCDMIAATLDYDFEQERLFSYKGIDLPRVVRRISNFVSGIWQIHPFSEGNTRTTAVFTIKYLRQLGYRVNNDPFKEHSWYFRNALVRANYKNAMKGINYSPVYLERFFRNLLLDDQWDLRNRYLHIRPTAEWSVQPNRTTSEQVPNKHRTSTEQVRTLVSVIGKDQLSLKQMMERIHLKHRPNFIDNYLTPAISDGYVRLLYPDKPRHPRQKYLLAEKGMALFYELTKSE